MMNAVAVCHTFLPFSLIRILCCICVSMSYKSVNDFATFNSSILLMLQVCLKNSLASCLQMTDDAESNVTLICAFKPLTPSLHLNWNRIGMFTRLFDFRKIAHVSKPN